ncbi:anthrone oxygenase family protein [uncultured Hoeflea sp.]|uniref:anthrone oxygenase family protein n=1 Tax=uncultured Hoeflea sp. TaxID=538666 RepID=UPI002634D37B|nr:anthrone oxygenase family protein [uncultured Hoeflea sp.]
MSVWFMLLCAVSVLAFAAIGGIFLAFSDFIMRAFNLVKNQAGIESMQVLNVEILRSVFIVLFMGLAAVSVIIIAYAGFAMENGTPRLMLMLAGGSYVVGVFAVTAIGNVPLNNRLAALQPASAAALEFWNEVYMTRWVTLNSVRTAACFIASGLVLSALIIL